MIKLISTLIFINFLRITFTEAAITTKNSDVKNELQAARIFAEIKPNEVLPLVLFKLLKRKHGLEHSAQVLLFPDNAVKAVTLDGKMAYGTTFSAKKSNDQMFFCPEKDSEKSCLVPQTFEKSDLLQCATEPNPVLRKDEMERSCGTADNVGTPYDIVYETCPNEDEYEINDPPIYEICYNTTLRKTLFAIHVILHPLLLKSNLLYRERTVPYPYTEYSTFKPLHFEEINFAPETDWDSLIHPDKPDYKLQKLVPDTDMAFALWRKPTYQSFNLDWQHQSLIPLWNKINNLVKTKAIQLHEKDIAIHVKTFTVDIIPASEVETVISNIWIKIVSTMPFNLADHSVQIIAILMNNFVVKETEDADEDTPKISNETDKFIETFCEFNGCIQSLFNEFEKVGGRVRCCSMTTQFAKVIGVPGIESNQPILYIKGINVSF